MQVEQFKYGFRLPKGVVSATHETEAITRAKVIKTGKGQAYKGFEVEAAQGKLTVVVHVQTAYFDGDGDMMDWAASRTAQVIAGDEAQPG